MYAGYNAPLPCCKLRWLRALIGDRGELQWLAAFSQWWCMSLSVCGIEGSIGVVHIVLIAPLSYWLRHYVHQIYTVCTVKKVPDYFGIGAIPNKQTYSKLFTASITCRRISIYDSLAFGGIHCTSLVAQVTVLFFCKGMVVGPLHCDRLFMHVMGRVSIAGASTGLYWLADNASCSVQIEDCSPQLVNTTPTHISLVFTVTRGHGRTLEQLNDWNKWSIFQVCSVYNDSNNATW